MGNLNERTESLNTLILEERCLKIELEDTKKCIQEYSEQMDSLEKKMVEMKQHRNMYLWAWKRVFTVGSLLFLVFLFLCFGSLYRFQNVHDLFLFSFTFVMSNFFVLGFVRLRKKILLNYQSDYSTICNELEHIQLGLMRVHEKEKLLLEKCYLKKIDIYVKQKEQATILDESLSKSNFDTEETFEGEKKFVIVKK